MKKIILSMAISLLAMTSYAQKSANKETTIQLIRNATVVFKYAGKEFLIDPLLAKKGAYPGFEGTANSHLRNPLVELPVPLEKLLNPDAVIVTHLHLDHWDSVAVQALPKNKPLYSQNEDDAKKIRATGFKDVRVLTGNSSFKNVLLQKTHAQHGSDEAFLNPVFRENIGKSSGILFSTKGKKSVYFAGDAVWNSDFEAHLKQLKPDIIVLNTGYAQVTGFGAIIMGKEDVYKAHLAVPNAKIVAIHMDAINHCVLSRAELKKYVEEKGLAEYVNIPEDGETVEL